MGDLRTITVMEHEVIPVIADCDAPDLMRSDVPWMTEEEARALLRLNDQRKGFCQRLLNGVKLAQHCGIVRLPSCIVEVLPKIGMDDARTTDELDRSRGALLSMLQSARQATITKVSPVPQETVRAPLLDIFIEAFLLAALEQAKRGLLSRYMAHTDDLPVIKGGFQAHGHIRRNITRPHLLHCEYDEFTADNQYNRAIRATLEACRAWISRPTTQRLWFETHSRFASVTLQKMTVAEVKRLPRNRISHRYDSVLKWCEWLLAIASPSMSAGAHEAPGLLFDMNKLFEAHVVRLEELESGNERIVIPQGPPVHLARRGQADVFLLKPDITVWHVGPDNTSTIERVLDAKWKRLGPKARDLGIDEADVYQLLAYAMRYGCAKVELAYPLFEGLEEQHTRAIFDISTALNSFTGLVQVRLKLIPLWHQQ